jgi:hypothetical protein
MTVTTAKMSLGNEHVVVEWPAVGPQRAVAFWQYCSLVQGPPLFDSDRCSLTNKSITGSVHGEEVLRLFRVSMALLRNCDLSKC